MTLDTRILIQDPIPVRPVFDYCRDLLGCTERHTWKRDESRHWVNPVIMNHGGQGLPAWLMVFSGPDGPLQRPDHRADDPPGFIEVSLDTAYGYHTPNGAGCGDLHAWLVRELGRWLDGRGVKWMWHNEYTGEWFERHDGLEQLGDADRGTLR